MGSVEGEGATAVVVVVVAAAMAVVAQSEGKMAESAAREAARVACWGAA